MNAKACQIVLCAALAAAGSLLTIPADAATIVTQPPCRNGGGVCAAFSAADPVPRFKAFVFVAPRAGTAIVSFHGTMNCTNLSAAVDGSHGVVDLSTQIVEGGGAPNYMKPGGQRFAMLLPPTNAMNYSYAVNLAASRVMKLKKGRHVLRNLLAKNRMDPNTLCTIFNGNLSVTFVP
jgi:hypothetical protein